MDIKEREIEKEDWDKFTSTNAFKFEGFEIYEAEPEVSYGQECIWFRRDNGEGMVISKKQLKDALEKLFMEWM